MNLKKIAVLESIKLNEKRIPIHPHHFDLIETHINKPYFQKNYAKHFGQNDHALKTKGFLLASREKLLEIADVVFLLKPIAEDLIKMKIGATLIGWCHAVQHTEISTLAQNRKLTLIAMEAMYKNEDKNR